MSWMDFKTAQALKAQKLASEGRKQNLGTQKGAGVKAIGVKMDSMSVKSATSAPKAARAVKGVNRTARGTFAPGALNPIDGSVVVNRNGNDAGIQAKHAPKQVFTAPEPTKSIEYDTPADQFSNLSISDGNSNQTYAESSYVNNGGEYNEGAGEVYQGNEGYDEGAYDEGYYEEGYDEGAYDEGYDENANGEGYYEEGYEEGYDEGYGEEGYYEEGYDEGYDGGYYEEGY